jgi:glycosyltransferase involved in cell wall biosynthesis
MEPKKNEVCYVGGIAEIRGVKELVRAMEIVASNTRLNLVGEFSEFSSRDEVCTYSGWSKVNATGLLERQEVRNILARSVAGLVTLHPVPNYLDSLPIKMFEYMSAGLPVIASNFDLWRDIVEKNDCGLCVDPMNPKAIASAIDFLVSNPIEAERMGAKGRQAVFSSYNWAIEEKKLFDFYDLIAIKS